MLSHAVHSWWFTAAATLLTPAGLALAALGAGIVLRFSRDIETPRNQDEDEERDPGDMARAA